MPAYCRVTLGEFVAANPAFLLGQLQTRYAGDGYATQFSAQTRSWDKLVPVLQDELRLFGSMVPQSDNWGILLEFPLYRLQRRIDAVILSGSTIIVVEAKVGERHFHSADARQVEEYSLDLRDFHARSRNRLIIPVLWATEAASRSTHFTPSENQVAAVHHIGKNGLASFLATIPRLSGPAIDMEAWDRSAYRPVPNVVQAATSIFAGHDVRSIAQADASNLKEAAARLVELIAHARQSGQRALVFLTGVPGSGKTLAGLQAVHDAVATGSEQRGDIVYLSGNTPLVIVLREALARDEYLRTRGSPEAKPLSEIRRRVRTRIQHINDFLKQTLWGTAEQPPHEHAIVFDEAQRAWDEEQGQKKFSRSASEPSLLLELMARHSDWCVCVCLIGGGQEINSGERGVAGWGDALRALGPEGASRWIVFAPPDVISGGPSTIGGSLGALPQQIQVHVEPSLQLEVPMRSYRSPAVSTWVTEVLAGNAVEASAVAAGLGEYPILLTRSLAAAREWLRRNARGERRYGLAASSGARRLRADGLGEILSATDGMEIAHWYLNPPGDIRASYALEVPANEYTCQGLELDFVGVCWGGNLMRDVPNKRWIYRRLNGSRWQTITSASRRTFVENGYRVLLTRAREGIVIWVPEGDSEDKTREPEMLQATAKYLVACGAVRLGS